MAVLTDVLKVQELLNQTGAELVADGVTGPATTAAIKQFQLENNLLPDGRISTELINALSKSVAETEESSSFLNKAMSFASENKQPIIILSSLVIFGYGYWFVKTKILKKRT